MMSSISPKVAGWVCSIDGIDSVFIKGVELPTVKAGGSIKGSGVFVFLHAPLDGTVEIAVLNWLRRPDPRPMVVKWIDSIGRVKCAWAFDVTPDFMTHSSLGYERNEAAMITLSLTPNKDVLDITSCGPS